MLRILAAILFLIISLFITGLAVAGPNEDAEKAFEKAFESGDDTTLRAYELRKRPPFESLNMD